MTPDSEVKGNAPMPVDDPLAMATAPLLNRILTWVAVIVPWGMMVAYLQFFWTYSPQYQYGWLVVPLGLRLFALRWYTLVDKRRTADIGARFATALFAFLIAPIWLIRQATTHWSIPGYGLTFLVIAYSFAFLALMGGWRLTRQMAIPLLFVLCAVKLPLAPEQWLIQHLSRFVAAAAVEILRLFEVTAVHSGNLVILSRGVIGISEACSGIHSLQSLFMVALFLGEERRMRISMRLFMVALGVILSLSFNIVRILILSVVCLLKGMTDFEQWHDSAGWSILGVSLVIMMFVANQFGGKVGGTHPKGPPPDLRRVPTWMATALSIWFFLTIAGTEWWYQIHDPKQAAIRHVEIQWPKAKPNYQPLEIPTRVRDITLCSDAHSATWNEDDKTQWTLSILDFGGGAKGISQWAPMHTPDICFPAAGMPLQNSYPSVWLKISDGELVFQCWEFRHRGASVFVFYSRHSQGIMDTTSPFIQDMFGISRVMQGQRNLGQQTVEFAIKGYSDYQTALEALKERLPSMVKMVK